MKTLFHVCSSSSFERLLVNHLLAALYVVSGVEQPIICLIIRNRQAVHSIETADRHFYLTYEKIRYQEEENDRKVFE